MVRGADRAHEERILACCPHATLRANLRGSAPGLIPHAVLKKFAVLQMLDVHFPTTDAGVDFHPLHPTGSGAADPLGATGLNRAGTTAATDCCRTGGGLGEQSCHRR